MTIIPAIDLKDGLAVRLSKGEMNSAKIYGDPLKFARDFEEMGAEWLHIVDLNGAFAGEPKNLEKIKQIRKSCNLKIELGGGIRNEDNIKMYHNLGVDRIILGSVACENLDFTLKMAQIYPIAVGIDAKNGKVAVNGWGESGGIDALDFAESLRGSHIDAIICTDINKDGMLQGMNVDFSENIFEKSQIPTIASGGFSSESDLEKLAQSKKISGVIVGKAFYEGKVDLKNIFQNYAT